MKHLLVATILLIGCTVIAEEQLPIDKTSGLVIDTGFEQVRGNCIACHSLAIVTQNRMSRDSWLETIRWMQKSQGLWPLQNEPLILDYLAKHYSPVDTGRRKQISAELRPPL